MWRSGPHTPPSPLVWSLAAAAQFQFPGTPQCHRARDAMIGLCAVLLPGSSFLSQS